MGNLYPDPEMKYRRYLSGGRLEQDGEWHCRYDADGNLVERHKGTGGWLGTKRERWRYRWNADGSLRSVTRHDGEEVVFGYDALGRRLSKGYRGTETRWLWDGNVPLHQWRQRRVYSVEAGGWRTEEGRGDMTLWLFEEGSFVPAAMVRGGRTYSLVTDQLDTPTEAYDADGNQVWGRVLDMDGRVIEETGNVGMVPFLFQGQYYDRETGLAYNRFRYYDPSTGAYISQDPIGLAGGILNLYGYVSDTNSWIDIFGLISNIITFTNSQGLTLEVSGYTGIGHMTTPELEALYYANNDAVLGRGRGLAGIDKMGNKIILHHYKQRAQGPIVAMPQKHHDKPHTNPGQHPYGKRKGMGLTENERAAFNQWKHEFWRYQAEVELKKRNKKINYRTK